MEAKAIEAIKRKHATKTKLRPTKAEHAEMVQNNLQIRMLDAAQMLLQLSYENAFKGLLVARGEDHTTHHDLTKLANLAQLEAEEDVWRYLNHLSAMNQLGRYRVAKFNGSLHSGTFWSDEFEVVRRKLDVAIFTLWRKYGAPGFDFIVDLERLS